MRRLLLLSITFITALLHVHPATANQPLNFEAKLGLVSQSLITEYLKNQNLGDFSSFETAKADLNADNIDEIILRPRECLPQNVKCTFLILAENSQKVTLLGKVSAYKLHLGSTFSYGIQDFLAFKSDNNDYEYVRYVWSPERSEYILENVH